MLGFSLNRREFLSKAGLTIPAIILASSESGRTQERNREYPVPTEGKRIELKDANFTIFPEKLDFKLGKKTLVVSTFWQTAAMYNADGTRAILKGEKERPFFLQVGTGKPDTPTRQGLWEVQTQNGVDYRSHEFYLDNKKTLGAPMPYAMHLGEIYINERGELESKRHTGIAIHGRDTVGQNSTVSFMSHGCIGIEKTVAEFLQRELKASKFKDGHVKRNFRDFGDYVLVIGEKMPELASKEPKDLLLFLKKEAQSVPKVEKRPERIRPKNWDWQTND